jgi:hypothetical protein
MEKWALAIAVLSALFSALAWWSNRRQAVASVEMVGIERKRDADEATEAAMAKIVPESVAAGPRLTYTVQLRNVGRATAVSLEAKVEAGGPNSVGVLQHSNFPCDVEPGTSASLVLLRPSTTAPLRALLVLTWIDGSGPRTEKTTVSLL